MTLFPPLTPHPPFERALHVRLNPLRAHDVVVAVAAIFIIGARAPPLLVIARALVDLVIVGAFLEPRLRRVAKRGALVEWVGSVVYVASHV